MGKVRMFGVVDNISWAGENVSWEGGAVNWARVSLIGVVNDMCKGGAIIVCEVNDVCGKWEKMVGRSKMA